MPDFSPCSGVVPRSGRLCDDDLQSSRPGATAHADAAGHRDPDAHSTAFSDCRSDGAAAGDGSD